MLLCVLKYGFCHVISWYELFKLSSFERLMKGNNFMCASSDVRKFSFSIKNYENNMLVRLAVVSCFNGSFVRKNFARLLSARAYLCAFMYADSNLTNASFLTQEDKNLAACYPFGFRSSTRERINTENLHDGNATEKPVLTSFWSEIFILERR